VNLYDRGLCPQKIGFFAKALLEADSLPSSKKKSEPGPVAGGSD